MTTYNMLKSLIEKKLFSTYEHEWDVIFNAYQKNLIDGDELDGLVYAP